MKVARQSLVLIALVLALTGCDALTTPQHRLARARAELDSGQLGRAAIDLRKLVQKDPRNADAWLLLARLAVNVGDTPVAQADLDHAVAAGALPAAVDPVRARAWLLAGKAQDLIDALSRRQLKGVTEPDRTMDLARAYIQLQRPRQAESALNPLLEAHPNLTEARLALVDALILDGKSDLARAQVERVLAADPHSVTAYLQRARLLNATGDHADAERSYVQAVQNASPRTPVTDRIAALIGLTGTRIEQGEIERAVQSEAVLIKLAPGSASAQLLGARLKLIRGDTLDGIADLQRIVAHAPSVVQAQILLGTTELKQGNLEQAARALQQAVQQAPGNVEARELLASVQLQLNQPNEAMRTLAPAMSARPADPQLLSLLGAVESRAGAPAVLQSLEADVQAHPQDRTMRLNLAEAYLASSRAREALALIEATPEVAGDTRPESLKVVALNMLQGPKAATAEVEKLLTDHPRDVGVLDLAAAFYTAQEQPTRAHALLEQALALDAHDVKTLVALSQADAAQGDLPGAETALRSALALDSTNSEMRLALANLLIRRKAFGEADAILAPISGLQAGPTVQFELARLALARGDLKQANTALDYAIAQQPKDAALVSQTGEVLMQAGQYQAALARFTAASQLAPNNALYWLDEGRAQLGLNQLAAARECFEKAAQLQPRWLPPISALVLIDLKGKDFQRALKRVDDLRASRPDDIDALALRGDVEWAMGDFKAAESTYATAEQRRPNAGIAEKVFRARLAARESNPEQPLLQWLALAPHDRSVRSVLGSYYLSEHALQQAAGQFQTILEQVPGDVLALNDLAWVYSEQKDPRAESLAQRAHELAPGQPNVDDTYGWILAREGKNAQALPLLAQAAKVESADPDVQYHYAFALVREGRRTEAQQILSSLLSDKREFASRHDAERLLADTRT